MVTGAVPHNNLKIPTKEMDKEWDRDREYNRVTVPTDIWTAVCCENSNPNYKFSLAILGKNEAEPKINRLSVEALEKELSQLYSRQIKIFAGACNSQNPKGQEVLSQIMSDLYNDFQNLANDSSQLLPQMQRNKLDKETSEVIGSTNLDPNKMQLTSTEFLMHFPSLADWSSYFEKVYDQDNLTCVLAPAAAAGVAMASGTLDRVCTLKEQKHQLGSAVTAQGWSCVGHVCGYHEGEPYSWCYTSYSKDWDYCCTDKCTVNNKSNRYECSRGDGKSTNCSPQYSTVTVSGKACRADHPCGLYGNSYYWCYTDYQRSWEYCCSPRHHCGKHNRDHWWCYTEDPQAAWKCCTL